MLHVLCVCVDAGMLTRQVGLSSERLWGLSLSQRRSCSTFLRRSPGVIPRPLSWELHWRLAETSTLNYRTHTFHDLRYAAHARVRMRVCACAPVSEGDSMASVGFVVALLCCWIYLAQGERYNEMPHHVRYLFACSAKYFQLERGAWQWIAAGTR